MKNYLYLILALVVMLASCGNDKTKEETNTKDTTTAKAPAPKPNQPEITEIMLDKFDKKAVLKFKLPRKENVSISVTDVNGVGLVSDQIKDVEGEKQHTIDLTKYPRLKDGLFYVYVVTHEGNLKARKEMILK